MVERRAGAPRLASAPAASKTLEVEHTKADLLDLLDAVHEEHKQIEADFEATAGALEIAAEALTRIRDVSSQRGGIHTMAEIAALASGKISRARAIAQNRVAANKEARGGT